MWDLRDIRTPVIDLLAALVAGHLGLEGATVGYFDFSVAPEPWFSVNTGRVPAWVPSTRVREPGPLC